MQNKSISEQLRIRVALLSDLQHTPMCAQVVALSPSSEEHSLKSASA